MLPIVALVFLFGAAAAGVTSVPYAPTAAPYNSAPASYVDNSKPQAYSAQQTYGKQANGYQGYPNQPYANNQVDLTAEVDEAKEDVAGLYANANQLNFALDANSKNIQDVSQFRADVEGTIAPRVRGLIKSQDYKIKEYREQLNELLVLRDEVEQLAQSVADVRKLMAENRRITVQTIVELENRLSFSVQQDIDIVKLVALQNAESAGIDSVKGLVYQNQNKNGELSDNLDAILKIVNLERAETFGLQLTKSQPSVTLSFSSAFASVPALEWGVVGLKLKQDQKEYNQNSYGGSYDQNAYDKNSYGTNSYGTNSYGTNSYGTNSYGTNSYDKNTYNLKSWNFKVKANASTTSVTVSLADSSLDWSVESVAVRVTATLIDNGKLEYTSRNIDYSSGYGRGNYKPGTSNVDYNPTTVEPTNYPATVKPTNYPATVKPTNYPATVKPTNYPNTVKPTTKYPTTVKPTNYPTKKPFKY